MRPGLNLCHWLAGRLAGWLSIVKWSGTFWPDYAVRAAAALLALPHCITAARPWSVVLFQLWVVMHLAEVAQIAVGVRARYATAVAFILH